MFLVFPFVFPFILLFFILHSFKCQFHCQLKAITKREKKNGWVFFKQRWRKTKYTINTFCWLTDFYFKWLLWMILLISIITLLFAANQHSHLHRIGWNVRISISSSAPAILSQFSQYLEIEWFSIEFVGSTSSKFDLRSHFIMTT